MTPLMNAATLTLRDVSVYRASEDGVRRPVISGLSLRIPAGQRCMLVGPNGAGKTSLLLALVGALPFSGEISLGETALCAKSLQAIRRRVGFVFANPDEQLFCETVWDEIAFGPRQLDLPQAEVEQRVQHALNDVALPHHAHKNPHQLSLGEQRRVAVAAALAMHPEVILFDEPTANLDPVARHTILRVLAHAQATVIMASHDLQAALALGATVALLNDGRLLACGDGRTLLADDRLLIEAGLALPDH